MNRKSRTGRRPGAASGWVPAVLCLIAAHPAAAVQIATQFQRSSEASVVVDGVIVDSQSSTFVSGPTVSNAFHGNLSSPTEARASGRSDQQTITSNAQFLSRELNYASPAMFEVTSAASIQIDGVSLTGGDVVVDFFLPAGFLEISTQAETDRDAFVSTADLFATITVCTPTCFESIADVLQFHSQLTGDYFSQQIEASAHSQTLGAFPFGGPESPLDVSTLTDLELEIVDGSNPQFIPTRTVTWSYPDFSGQVNIGPIPGGQPFTLTYDMSASVVGGGPLSGAIAAINDPFDITQLPMPSVDQLPIPEPGTGLLVALGLVGLGSVRRR